MKRLSQEFLLQSISAQLQSQMVEINSSSIIPWAKEFETEALASPWNNEELTPKSFAERYFSTGYQLEQSGRREEANWVYRAVVDTLDDWHEREPKVLSKLLLSRLALQHGKRLSRLAQQQPACLREARTTFQTASHYAELALEVGASSGAAEALAQSLSFLGDSYRRLGMEEESFLTYRRSVKLWRMVKRFGRPGREANAHSRALAATLIGASRTLKRLKQNGEAEKCREEAKRLFQQARAKLS